MLPSLYISDAHLRKQQINTLKIFNANVTEVQEDTEYQLTFDCGGSELCLHVILGKNFPKEKPTLNITPVIVHQWVNSEGEITSAPGLLNFTEHSDLGRVVQAIIREFQRTPPPLVSNHPSNSVTSPSSIFDGENQRNSPNLPTYTNLNNFSPPSAMPVQNAQSVRFPELNKLSLTELQFLLENDDRQQEFFDELPYIKEQNKILDDQIAIVEELAESNLSKQEELQNLRKEIDVKIEEVTKLAFENERLHVHYQNLSEKYSPRNIQDLLRIAAQVADSECEKIAESFLSGEIDVDRFVSQFIGSKTLCQTRKTKEEKLSYQLDSLERAGF